MKKQEKIRYQQLEVGYELPGVRFTIDQVMFDCYLTAVQEPNGLFRNNRLVPPMAVATYAMATIADGVSLPPGTIYTHGDVEFLSVVNVGDTISCQGRVSQKQVRGTFHLITVEFSVFNQGRKQVLTGKTSFILPELDNES